MSRSEPRALVIGGSIGGLSAAVSLRERGFEVTVHERTRGKLADRGAGIVAHPTTLQTLLAGGGFGVNDLSIASRSLRYLDADGRVTHEEPSGYRFTSWQTLHSGLLARLDEGDYRRASELVGFEQDERRVRARFADGSQVEADFMVAADGTSSATRRMLVGDVRPMYSGYVGWRGIVARDELETGDFEALGNDITYQLLDRGHILAYPIPAPRNPGEDDDRKFVNWVWYRNVPSGRPLHDLMTAATGTTRDLSVPPGAVGGAFVDELRTAAEASLHPTLGALVAATLSPFIQVVVDVEVPRMAFGRVCLLGDAAFVARPHAAAGTVKAADDAHRLAEVMGQAQGDIHGALRAYEQTQLKRGGVLVERSRQLGDAVQFSGSWEPGDPALLFGYRRAGDSCFLPPGVAAPSTA